MSATYVRLASGAWGVRVPTGDHDVGDVVHVAKRDGSSCYATLGSVVQCGGMWTLYRLAASGSSPQSQRIKPSQLIEWGSDHGA